ncbi:hypothetical protein RIR_jg11590.t1 [Rhizophagus irregularis DAOM 181602=DAOM 197198]|nr:hypothetical protein RIR_jg11590.t1 [Rhizophagus irregularis DAOM 181602=DAOM 197198]CAB5360427.1 unnamed protein product [Rhizophagus irregularis]
MNYVKKCNKDEEFNMKIDAIDYGISEDAEKIDDIKNLIMIVMRNSDKNIAKVIQNFSLSIRKSMQDGSAAHNKWEKTLESLNASIKE